MVIADSPVQSSQSTSVGIHYQFWSSNTGVVVIEIIIIKHVLSSH